MEYLSIGIYRYFDPGILNFGTLRRRRAGGFFFKMTLRVSGVREAIDELVVDAGVHAANAAGARARVAPRVLVQSLPGLAHSHEPTRERAVEGCEYCARRGNALADPSANATDPPADPSGTVPGLPCRQDIVARLQLPFLEAIADTYSELLDMVEARGLGGVDFVRRQIVNPMRECNARWRQALAAADSPPPSPAAGSAGLPDDDWTEEDGQVLDAMLRA